MTVLVDGDGAIFRNEFYDNPAHGAQKASVALQQEVRSHLKKTQLDADDVPILVRIFANLHGLAGKMRSLDIIESDKDMRIFAEYFNKSRAEFDMVDVGSGKENADAKMRSKHPSFAWKEIDKMLEVRFSNSLQKRLPSRLKTFSAERSSSRVVMTLAICTTWLNTKVTRATNHV